MSRKLPDGEKNRFRDTHDAEAMPREQFKRAEDPRTVPDEAVVAVLLRTGTHGCNVLELARRLIEVFGSLKALVSSDWRGIMARVREYNKSNPQRRIAGFGEVKCLELAAAFELGRRRQRLSLLQPTLPIAGKQSTYIYSASSPPLKNKNYSVSSIYSSANLT